MQKVKKVLWSILAGLTTKEAIRAEKIIAVVLLTRAAVVVPGVALWINMIVKALS